MSTVTFGLREEFAGTVTQYEDAAAQERGEGREVPVYLGGVIAAGDVDVNPRDLLDDPDAGPEGLIVVEDTATALVAALEQVPVLKRVANVEGADAVTAERATTLASLREQAKREGLEGYSGLKREELERALATWRDRRAAAVDAAIGSPEAEAATVTDARLLADAGDPNPTED